MLYAFDNLEITINVIEYINKTNSIWILSRRTVGKRHTAAKRNI
jgi:hypothetical protein